MTFKRVEYPLVQCFSSYAEFEAWSQTYIVPVFGQPDGEMREALVYRFLKVRKTMVLGDVCRRYLICTSPMHPDAKPTDSVSKTCKTCPMKAYLEYPSTEHPELEEGEVLEKKLNSMSMPLRFCVSGELSFTIQAEGTSKGWYSHLSHLHMVDYAGKENSMQRRLDSFFRPSDDGVEQPKEKKLKVVSQPLAERMRPRSLDDFVIASQSLLAITRLAKLPSMILWGPPGCGKTSLANLLVEKIGLKVFKLSAVNASVADLKLVHASSPAVLFLDEIHRFNKSQQDYLLPHVESGSITLIGATTENVYFSVNKALLSRCRVIQLPPLPDASITLLLHRAASQLPDFTLTEQAVADITRAAAGDARQALNMLEVLHSGDPTPLYIGTSLDKSLQVDAISALQKSIRGSERDAALIWLALLLENGEDPMYIARRIVRTASEDIGLANPMALVLCTAAMQSTALTGMPECSTALAEAVCYLCDCPKSNAVEVAYFKARDIVASMGNRLTVPSNIAAQKRGYVYTNQPELKPAGAFKGVQQYLPNGFEGEVFPKGFNYQT